MRVLVTGASGFIGANLARALLDAGDEVHLLLRPDHDLWRIEEILDRTVAHDADLRDQAAVQRVVREARPQRVYHLAAYGAYPQQRDRDLAVATNLEGTLNLAGAALAAGSESFLNAGTSSEYGHKDHAPREDEPLEPEGPYAETKAEATRQLAELAEGARSHHVVTLRIYSAYGPWEEPTRFIPALVLEGLEGRFPPLAAPDTARDFVHVGEVCRAFLLAGDAPSGVYNVGTGVQTTLAEAAGVARRLFAIEAEPSWSSYQDREWDTSVWVCDARKARETFGWMPELGFEEGLGQTAGWFRRRPDLAAYYRRRRAVPSRE
jgi:dolichol-phosphate mannosyltransferase